MTDKEKAQAYDKVVNKLSKFMKQGIEPLITRKDVQDFFPELAESEDEDEKIRKDIVTYLLQPVNIATLKVNAQKFNKWIAWLEKQCTKSFETCSIKEKAHQIAWETSKHYDPFLSKESWCEMAALDMASWLKKQGEKKSTDNMTQQEAMDIAVAKCFNEQEAADKVEPKFKVGNTIKYVGERKELAVDKYTIKEICNDCYITTCGSKIPFRMQEYYVIVNDAKGLKKIENEHICELDNSYTCVKFPFKAKVKSSGTIVTIHNGQLSSDGKEWIKYQSGAEDGYKIYEPNNLELVCEIKQNSAWSEEDDAYKLFAISAVEDYYDEKNPLHKGIVDWLESLKQRAVWNPSKEQIRALRWVLNNIPYNTHKEEISGLLDQIKDL